MFHVLFSFIVIGILEFLWEKSHYFPVSNLDLNTLTWQMLKCILVFKEISRASEKLVRLLMLAVKHVSMYLRSKVLPGLIFVVFPC